MLKSHHVTQGPNFAQTNVTARGSLRAGLETSIFLLDLHVIWLLPIADVLIDTIHVRMGDRCEQRVFARVAWHREAPHVGPAVDWCAIRAVAGGMLISPIRLVVDHAPLVLGGEVPHAVVVVRQGEGPLAVPIRKWLAAFLVPAMDV